MSNASPMQAPQHVPDHCPSCGGNAIDWGKVSKSAQKPNLKLRITHIETGIVVTYKTQQARTFLVLNAAGKAGVCKAQVPGLHLGHYAQMMRDDGLPCTTEMITTVWPWKGKYGLYRLAGNYRIEDISQPKKKPAARNKRASNTNPLRQNKGGVDE